MLNKLDFGYLKNYLKDDVTCVLSIGDMLITSKERGIKPLLEWLSDNTLASSEEVVAADKIVGKAAAFIYVKGNVSGVYAEVLSLAGKEIFEKYGIVYEYKTLTEKIINRKGTDICPMEKAVAEIADADEAVEILKKRGEIV